MWRAIAVASAILAATGCEAKPEPVESGGVITYTLAGQTYEERTIVNAILEGSLLGIGWNESPGGDLGQNHYGSLSLFAFTGTGSYAPMTRMSDIDAVIQVPDGAGGAISYYPLANQRAGDGSVEVTSASDLGVAGTFAFTGDRSDGVPDPQPITGTFDVTFGE